MDKPKTIKALITYKDWMLLERGEIRPEIGDKIVMPYAIGGSNMPCKVFKIENVHDHIYIYRSKNLKCHINNIHVEINYNPNAFKEGYKQAEYCHRSLQEIDKKNHAIEFAKWMETPRSSKIGGQVASGLYSIEEYYNLFKNSLNEKEIQSAQI